MVKSQLKKLIGNLLITLSLSACASPNLSNDTIELIDALNCHSYECEYLRCEYERPWYDFFTNCPN